MIIFIPIQYGKKRYSDGIDCKIHEVAGHFDKENIENEIKYSLHTEYSHSARKLNHTLIQKYPIHSEANKNGIPQLWKSKEWSEVFADYITALIANHNAPEIIEIHPPFNDYCNSIELFLDRYSIF